MKPCHQRDGLAHLARGGKVYNTTPRKPNRVQSKRHIDPQTEWNRKGTLNAKTKNRDPYVPVVDAGQRKSRFSFHNITFSKDDPIPEHYTGEDPLIISADVGTTQIHKIYVDGGKLAALGHFLSKSTKRSLAFFKTLKGYLSKKEFQWSIKAEAAFQELKTHL
ncbi:hypothetical protein Tco_0294590 [Tanacetum coccineum]